MADQDGVNIPVNSTANLAGFDAAAQASLNLGARLRELEGEEGKAGQPIAPKVSLPGGEEVESKLHELSESASEFVNAIKLGVGINIGEKLIEGLGEIKDGLEEAVKAGIEYNVEVQSSTNALASSLQSVQPELYKTRDAAKEAAAGIFDQVRDYANANGLEVKTTLEALSANYHAFIEAGVTDTGRQIEFISTVLSAEASKGISGQRALIDSIDLLTGKVEKITFAKEIGVTSEGFNKAAESGKQLDYVMDHLTGYRAGIADFGGSFAGLAQSVKDIVTQLEGGSVAPVFAEIQAELAKLKTELKDPAVAAGLKEIGFEIGAVVHTGADLLNFCVQNAGALAKLAEGTALVGVAIGAVTVKNLVLGLGEYLFATQAATVATVEETVAVEANTAANVAGAAGTSRFGAAVGGLVTPMNVALVAGIALNALIVKLAADTDLASQKLNTAGTAFDKARGSNADFLGDAQTTAGYEKRRKALQDEIAAEKKIVADGTSQDFVADGAGGRVEFETMSDAAEKASERVVLLENRLRELDGVRRGQIDTTNLVATKQVEETAKVVDALQEEATAGDTTKDKVVKAREDIIQVTKEQADAQADLSKINSYLASDEGKRLAATKEGQEAIKKLQADAKKDLADIATAEQKLADLRASAYPKETAEIAALNDQLRQMKSDGTEATADARAALQNQLRDLTNTTKGVKPTKTLDELERESDARAADDGDPTQADQDFLRRGVNTQGALPGAVDPNGTGAISDFGRRPDISQPAEHNDTPPTDPEVASDISTAADNTGQTDEKATAAAGSLAEQSELLNGSVADLAANAGQVTTGLQTLGQKQEEYHSALLNGLQSNADGQAANIDALTKILSDQARVISQQAGQISQLQLVTDNLGSDDS